MAALVRPEDRMMLHTKSDRRVLKSEELPRDTEGSNGDIAVGQIKGNPILFAKVDNKWHSTALNPLHTSNAFPKPDYDSGWFFIEDGSTTDTYKVSHKLGTPMIFVQGYLRLTENSHSSVPDKGFTIPLNIQQYDGSAVGGIFFICTNADTIQISTGNSFLMDYDNMFSTTASNQRITEADLRVLVWKLNTDKPNR